MARGKLNQGQQASRQVRVGLVILLAMVLLVLGVFQVGKLFDVFASRYPLVTFLGSSGGLIEGAPVTLAGQRIGQVTDIEFLPVGRHDSASIFLRLSINEDVREQIRSDSRAALQTQGLLGDRFIDISPGSAQGAILEPGDTLQSVAALDYESVLRTAAATMEQVTGVVADLRVIIERLEAGEGTLGALLVDDRLYQQMTSTSQRLAGLLATINASDGTLARVIRDPTLYRRMNTALARLDSLGQTILAGEGTLNRLIHDDSLYTGLVGLTGRADSTLSALDQILARAADGDGTLTRLLEDPELYDQFLKTVVDLQNLIQTIREDPSALSPEIRVF